VLRAILNYTLASCVLAAPAGHALAQQVAPSEGIGKPSAAPALLPEVTVGRHARLTRVVIDHGCQIPEGMVIGEDPVEDARRFERTEKGVTLVTRDMLAQLG